MESCPKTEQLTSACDDKLAILTLTSLIALHLVSIRGDEIVHIPHHIHHICIQRRQCVAGDRDCHLSVIMADAHIDSRR